MGIEFHPEMNLIAPQLCVFGVDAVRDGTYISLKNCQRAFIVCLVVQGADATQHTFTLKQATAGAGTATGTSEKALLVNSPVWLNQNCALSNILTAATATLGAYQLDAEVSRTKILVFDIVPERDLDVANGFDTIGVDASDFGASNLGGAFAILIPARYAPLPSVYAD